MNGGTYAAKILRIPGTMRQAQRCSTNRDRGASVGPVRNEQIGVAGVSEQTEFGMRHRAHGVDEQSWMGCAKAQRDRIVR